MKAALQFALLLTALILIPFPVAAAPDLRPFGIEVVDDATGRGVPLVELETINHIRFVTDSNGMAAIADIDLMGRTIYFHVRSHGHEYPKDGFGFRGKALKVEAGGRAILKIKRINVAERRKQRRGTTTTR